MDIYIKPQKKASLCKVNKIVVSDVAEVIATADVAKKVRDLKLLDINITGKKANFLISVTDVIKAIKKVYPDYTVNNVGAQDTVVQYATLPKKDNALIKWLKVAFVVAILVAGSSTAIMSFHTDGQIPRVFENYYRIFFGHEVSNPLIINIPYAIGLAVGIVVFFNHFMGKKLTDDPTPIEVEMSLYETDVNDTVTEVLNAERQNNSKQADGQVEGQADGRANGQVKGL